MSETETQAPAPIQTPATTPTEPTQPIDKAEAAPPTPEAEKPPETPVESKDEKRFHSRIAYLSQREKKLQDEQQALNRARQEVEQKHQQVMAAINQAKENPLKAIQEVAGYTMDDLVQFALNNNQLTPQQEIGLLKKQMSDKEAAEAKARKDAMETYNKQAYTQAVQQAKQQVANLVEANPDQYELVKNSGDYDTVVNLIETQWNQTQQVISFADAAQMYEDYLTKEAEKYLKAKKFQPKAPTPIQDNEDPKAIPGVTLTNRTGTNSTSIKTKPLSREESLKEAAKLLKFNNDGGRGFSNS